MEFEWDKKKSQSNQTKHGISFNRARALWNDPNGVEIQAPYPLENRSILIGKIEKKLWAVIYTRRGDAIRIISARRARKRETQLYEQKKVGQD